MIKLEQVKNLEKIDLHRHVDGDIKPDIIFEIAKEEGIGKEEFPYTSLKELEGYVKVRPEDDFFQILAKFRPAITVMQTAAGIERVFKEEVKNCFEDNITKAELRFAPLYHQMKGLNIEEVISSAIKGVESGEKEYDIKAGVIICINREIDPKYSEELVKAALKFENNGVVGIDLACDEIKYPPLNHKKAYEKTFGTNIHRTVHAGEAGDRMINNIIESIQQLKAVRLGHAIPLAKHQNLIKLVKDGGIGIESCPLSNLTVKQLTGVNNIKQLGLKKLLDSGVLISLNSDDPGLFGYTLSDVYYQTAKLYNLDMENLKKFNENADITSFV